MDHTERTRLQHEESLQRSHACLVTTKLERGLLIILVIVVIIGIGLSIALHTREKSNRIKVVNETSSICLSQQCISTAADLLHSMDMKQNPCEDFYAFACGNWIKNCYLEGEISTTLSRLNNIITLRIKELLAIPNSRQSEHENKTTDFYKACMDLDNRDYMGSKALEKDLEKFGGWPLMENNWNASKFDWSDLTVQLFEAGFPNSMLLGISIDMDIKNTSTSLISITQPSLGISERGYYLLTKSKVINQYKELVLKLALLMKPDLNSTLAAADIENAFKIEKALAEVTFDERIRRHPKDYYNIMTMKEIEKFAPKIPWRKLLTKLLPSHTILQDSQRIMVANPLAVKTLNTLLLDMDNNIGKKHLANYMLYRVVVFASQHLGQKFFWLYQDKIPDKGRQKLWKSCVTTVMDHFHMSVTGTYAERYMNAEMRSELEMMLQGIRVALTNEIKDAKWMDKETKEKAMLKVKMAKADIAYRDEMLEKGKLDEYYYRLKVGDDHFSNVKAALAFESKHRMEGLNTQRIRFRWSDTANLLTANAFYQPTENSITIPIGILQETIFTSGRPSYLNYGSLGTILGHEFMHAFDSSGSLYDENGNYHMWWTNSSWTNFKGKTECFVNQYDKYYEPQVGSFMNGTTTLNENIADNGGLMVAYEAYQRLYKKIGKEKQLPGLPYTDRQMFWIAFASVWCRKQTDHSLENTIEKSVHAPAKFRIIGALSNIKEFSEDFQCKKGTPLNPQTRCPIWK